MAKGKKSNGKFGKKMAEVQPDSATRGKVVAPPPITAGNIGAEPVQSQLSGRDLFWRQAQRFTPDNGEMEEGRGENLEASVRDISSVSQFVPVSASKQVQRASANVGTIEQEIQKAGEIPAIASAAGKAALSDKVIEHLHLLELHQTLSVPEFRDYTRTDGCAAWILQGYEQLGWVSSVWKRSRRVFSLTAAGANILDQHMPGVLDGRSKATNGRGTKSRH